MTEHNADRIVRMGVNFGIYDPRAESLTDLGRTLLRADSTVPHSNSPFQWPLALRFLGLRILIGADGDLILPLVRNWPETVLDDALTYLSKSAQTLLEQAVTDEERHGLLRLVNADSAKASQERVRQATWLAVYPTLEPLRELGYLERRSAPGEKRARYALTAAGERLRSALVGQDDSLTLLLSRFAHIFFQTEGMTPTRPAAPLDIRKTLQELPLYLLGPQAVEAPLEPVVLLTQIRLLVEEPGTYIELDQARGMIEDLTSLTQGAIGLKAGRMVFESNITWLRAEHLNNGSLWQSEPQSKTSDAPEVPATVADLYHQLSLDDTRRGLLGLLGERRRWLQSPLIPTGPSLRELFWLQHVAHLLEPPSLGGVSPFEPGGPWSWLTRMLRLAEKDSKYLNPKRARKEQADREWVGEIGMPEPPASYLLGRWLDVIGEMAALRSLVFARYAWTESTHVPADMLHASIHMARGGVERHTQYLADAISAFLFGAPASNVKTEKDSWGRIVQITNAMIEDLLDSNISLRRELRSKLHRLVGAGPARRIAQRLLREMAYPDDEQRLLVSFAQMVPHAVWRYTKDISLQQRRFERGQVAVEIEPLETPDVLRIMVELNARTRDLAIVQAKEHAWEELKRIHFVAANEIGYSASAPDPVAEACEEIAVTNNVGDAISAEEMVEPTVLLSPMAGFQRQPTSSGFISALIQRLPTGGAPRARTSDASARFGKTLHWLTAADQPGLHIIHRISNAWIAVEHLVAEDSNDHGVVVARTLADVGALCRLESLGGELCRELCAALCRTILVHPSNGDGQLAMAICEEPIGNLLGEAVLRRVNGESLDQQPVLIEDRAGFQVLIFLLDYLPEIADIIEMESPLATWRIRSFVTHVKSARSLARWLRSTRLEIESLVLHIYEVRNQLFHEGATFGIGEAARLESIYLRFRMLLDAIMARVVAVMDVQQQPIAMERVWAHLGIGTRELLHRADGIPKTEKDRDCDRRQLIRCVLGIDVLHSR